MSETYAACLTPSGSGAIAVIALTGPDAWTIARRLFRPASARPLPEIPSACSTWFGRIGPSAGDEVILAVTSTAPTCSVEIHCHGGRQVVRMLLDLCQQEGCSVAEVVRLPSSRSNTPVAEVVRLSSSSRWDLVSNAKTLRTAGILLDQANGAFDRAIQTVRDLAANGQMREAQAQLRALTRYEDLGRHLTEPWRIVIAGAPNVGKSSLLNALAGYQRSVVAPVPGTTRDIVTATLAFDGWLVEIADTAGLREATDEIEQEGISRARQQMLQADLCLLVIDVTSPLPDFLRQPFHERVLYVLNKVDQPALWETSAIPEGIAVSATNGEGLDHLIQRVVQALVPDSPSPGAAVPVTDEDRVEMATLLKVFDNNQYYPVRFPEMS